MLNGVEPITGYGMGKMAHTTLLMSLIGCRAVVGDSSILRLCNPVAVIESFPLSGSNDDG